MLSAGKYIDWSAANVSMGPRQTVRRVVEDVVNAGARSGQLVLDAASKAELGGKIVDAFESGRVHEGILLFVEQANNLRARAALIRIMDSALLTLGVTVQGAREAWFAELSKLSERLEAGALPGSPRESPVRDAFRGITVPLAPATSEVLRRLALVEARFERSLETALCAPDPLKALERFTNELSLWALPDQSIMALLESFAERESFADVVKVFERAPESFRSYAAPKREYALALHLLGRNMEARSVLLGLVRQHDTDPVVAGLLGKLYKHEATEALAKGDLDAGRQCLIRAVASYQRGFAMDRTQLYPGVNVPSLLLALGRDKEAIAHARTILTLAELRSSYATGNFFDATAAIEMCALLRDEAGVHTWVERAVATASEPWQRRSAVGNLQRLAQTLDDKGRPSEALNQAIRSLSAIEASNPGEGRSAPNTNAGRMLSAVQDVTYRFEARHARRLTGNYQLAGIAHDVRVTPADLRFFTRIANEKGLDQLSDPGEVSKAIDVLIRQRFGTDALEESDGPAHQVFDQTMPGLARFMAAQQDSQTNVSADWLNGLGDCRQHAPTKMLLFEAWKRTRTDRLMSKLLDAHGADDKGRAAEIRAELFELARYEMRVMDALILNHAGGELIEEHTLTVLSTRKPPDANGEMRELDELRLADSFYHRVHALADGVLSVTAVPHGVTFEVPNLSADGRQLLLLPAPYSRDRSLPNPDFGQLEFRGVQVASPGWEQEVPTQGLDLAELHAYVRKASGPRS